MPLLYHVQVMKIVRRDAVRSAVTASPGPASLRRAPHYAAAHAYSFIPTILNSLFVGSCPYSRAAKPMNFRHFRRRPISGSDQIPCNFPC